jgi:3-hydroxybutyryl-CoA dehydrogenase
VSQTETGIEIIGVIGAGTMGGGIAQACLQAGYAVILHDVSTDAVETGRNNVRKRLADRVAAGKIKETEKDGMLSRLRATARIEDCGEAGLIIEAVVEIEDVKADVFRRLDTACSPKTIFTSNTSSISITRLAAGTQRPERFAGMHFMNPAYAMKLVEVVRGLSTSDGTVATVETTARTMGKTPVVVGDSPGFVSNRLLMPLINEAVFCLQEGVADREGIDAVMRLGANHPMGPLELADLIGLDTCLEIMEILKTELGEKFRPCALLGKMVAAGRLGRKSGEGFYEYR